MKRKVSISIVLLLCFSMLLTGCGRDLFNTGSSEDTLSSAEEFSTSEDAQDMTEENVLGYMDVSPDSSYKDFIVFVTENGYMTGVDAEHFAPEAYIDQGSAVALLSKMRSQFYGDGYVFEETDPWYQSYVDYAIENNIIEQEYEDYFAPVKRGQFAVMLVNSVPAASLVEINSVEEGYIPDVSVESYYHDAVYQLYRAGIFTGIDEDGDFAPEENISRQVVACAITRIMASSMRGKIRTDTQKTEDETSYEPEEGPVASDDYFTDTLVIGDFMTAGLRDQSTFGMPTYYTADDLSATSSIVERFPDIESNQFGKIYIGLGINDMDLGTEAFKDAYSGLINEIRQYDSYAAIYLMSMLPVTQDISDSGTTLNSANILSYNSIIKDLASEQGCYYLDVYSQFADSENYLAPNLTSDGIHLNTAGYILWENYIRTHYHTA